MSEDTNLELQKDAMPVKKAGRPPKAVAQESDDVGKAQSAIKRKPHWPKDFVPTGDPIADTKTLLDAGPKVAFFIPLASDEKPGAEEIVQINGYKLTIKKGHMVDLPEACVHLLANKYKVEMDVARRAIAYSSKDKVEALS